MKIVLHLCEFLLKVVNQVERLSNSELVMKGLPSKYKKWNALLYVVFSAEVNWWL